jgi:hypothetical protein
MLGGRKMAANLDKIEQYKADLKVNLMDSLKVGGTTITEKGMSKEGTDNAVEYLELVTNKLVGGMIKQTMASSNYFPLILDPTVWDQKALYNMSPGLSYLESRGCRRGIDTTKMSYIEMMQGFQAEWITETGNTTTNQDAVTTLGEAQICIEAVPFALSDLIGAGVSAPTRQDFLAILLQTLREGLDNVIINGNATSGGNPTNEFNGLITLAQANGATENMNNTALTLDDLRQLDADLFELQKGHASFVLTDKYTFNDILSDMTPTLVNMNRVDGIVAGVNVIGYQTDSGSIPIIVDPYSPTTAGGKHCGLYNEQYVQIRDLITPSWVEAGRTLPVASNGWVIQATLMANNIPAKTADAYNIA